MASEEKEAVDAHFWCLFMDSVMRYATSRCSYVQPIGLACLNTCFRHRLTWKHHSHSISSTRNEITLAFHILQALFTLKDKGVLSASMASWRTFPMHKRLIYSGNSSSESRSRAVRIYGCIKCVKLVKWLWRREEYADRLRTLSQQSEKDHSAETSL